MYENLNWKEGKKENSKMEEVVQCGDKSVLDKFEV